MQHPRLRAQRAQWDPLHPHLSPAHLSPVMASPFWREMGGSGYEPPCGTAPQVASAEDRQASVITTLKTPSRLRVACLHLWGGGNLRPGLSQLGIRVTISAPATPGSKAASSGSNSTIFTKAQDPLHRFVRMFPHPVPYRHPRVRCLSDMRGQTEFAATASWLERGVGGERQAGRLPWRFCRARGLDEKGLFSPRISPTPMQPVMRRLKWSFRRLSATFCSVGLRSFESNCSNESLWMSGICSITTFSSA